MKQDLCVKHKCVWTHTYVHFGAPVELWSPQIVWTNVGQKLDISFLWTNIGQMSENVLGTAIGQKLDKNWTGTKS